MVRKMKKGAAIVDISVDQGGCISRLLKNTHLLRYALPSSLRRTGKYPSFLRISRALHLDVFDQPAKDYFFNNLLDLPPHNAQRSALLFMLRRE